MFGIWSTAGAGTKVRFGSWLCENAKTLNRNRRSYSSKTVLVAQRASGFNLEIELKNIILRRVSIFEFLHSQGQSRRSDRPPVTSGLPDERTYSEPFSMSQRCREETSACLPLRANQYPLAGIIKDACLQKSMLRLYALVPAGRRRGNSS